MSHSEPTTRTAALELSKTTLDTLSEPAAALAPDIEDVVWDTSPVLHVERVTMLGMIGHQPAWQDLCARVLEPNVFLQPSFALPLLQHVLAADRPDFLLVWEENGPTTFGRLIGLLAFNRPSRLAPTVLRGFADSRVKLGAPLLDRQRAGDALDAMLAWMCGGEPDANAIRFTDIDADGPFMALLTSRVAASGRAIRRFGEYHRAVLRTSGAPKIMPLLPTKRRKELDRQRRRLSELGVRTYTSAVSLPQIIRATERFLALEHNGWKGNQGTALLANPVHATFTRTMTRLMAHEGRCRIDSIEIDGRPVAMGILLIEGDRVHFWKTAFDEQHAPLSPGVQFAMDLTKRQLADPSISLTDSCAVPDHPMIDRFWPDRMAVTDVLVELYPLTPKLFGRACRRERQIRDLRAWAKRWYRRLRG